MGRREGEGEREVGGREGERKASEREKAREEGNFLTKYRVTINELFGRGCFWKTIRRI